MELQINGVPVKANSLDIDRIKKNERYSLSVIYMNIQEAARDAVDELGDSLDGYLEGRAFINSIKKFAERADEGDLSSLIENSEKIKKSLDAIINTMDGKGIENQDQVREKAIEIWNDIDYANLKAVELDVNLTTIREIEDKGIRLNDRKEMLEALLKIRNENEDIDPHSPFRKMNIEADDVGGASKRNRTSKPSI